ncbi:hypothetical protein, partial [Nonomuraea longicatena]|uniref:hypothetical protein n=1 Tax=Nonomuraea longicatena TaxID=83682 RepID=UPI0031D99E8C
PRPDAAPDTDPAPPTADTSGSTATTDADAGKEPTADGPTAGEAEPVTASATCERCGTVHTVTIPAGETVRMVVCDCGTDLYFVRNPHRPGPATRQSRVGAGRHRHPYPAPTTVRRTRTVSTFPLAAVAAEMNAAAAAYAPTDMWVVARELDQMPEVAAYVALAIRTYTTRLQAEYPIDPAVVEAIHRMYQGQALLVSAAEEIGPLFRQVHAEDLRREEAPRTNEPLWNV